VYFCTTEVFALGPRLTFAASSGGVGEVPK